MTLFQACSIENAVADIYGECPKKYSFLHHFYWTCLEEFIYVYLWSHIKKKKVNVSDAIKTSQILWYYQISQAIGKQLTFDFWFCCTHN